MYQCSKCGGTMSYPHDVCPCCGVLLSGVKCQGCGYTGAKSVFINNGHKCPKCDSIVHVPGSIGGRKKGDCFIATAVFQDYDCWEVVRLRVLRDRHLLRSRIGRFLVRFYYKTGPLLSIRLQGGYFAREVLKPALHWLAARRFLG